ncbi:MAG TPA: hypoxanthine phosphoribosyltransferase [Bacteroidia bacterium]|nr:hypoxanthine phosphoribosyltransferase [Bacteroidia bacterium]
MLTTNVTVGNKPFKPLITEAELQTRVRAMGRQITTDYSDRNPVLIGVLKGAAIFLSDLIREVKVPCSMTFMRIKSYSGTQSTGKISKELEFTEDIEGRHVIIVEDIVDTGNTARFLFEELKKHRPATIALATLLFKPMALLYPFKPDYTAFEIGNDFVVGYGLDYDEHGRNLKDIYVMESVS